MNLHVQPFKKILLPLLIVLAATVSAFVIATTVLAESAVKWQETARLNKNCESIIIPETAEINTVFNPTTGVVDVGWYIGEQENHVDLPLVVTTKCNASNRAILKQVKQSYDDQVQDTCVEFKGMIDGTIPIAEKNGESINLAGARQYVNKYCK